MVESCSSCQRAAIYVNFWSLDANSSEQWRSHPARVSALRKYKSRSLTSVGAFAEYKQGHARMPVGANAKGCSGTSNPLHFQLLELVAGAAMHRICHLGRALSPLPRRRLGRMNAADRPAK